MKITLSNEKSELNTFLFAEEQADNQKFTKDFNGEAKQSRLILSHERTLLIGLGKNKEIKLDQLRSAMSIMVGTMKDLKLEKASVQLPKLELSSADVAVALAEGLILSDYDFNKYKLENKDKSTPIKEVFLDAKQYQVQIEKAIVVCENVKLVRDMQNENADIMNTLEIEKRCRSLAKSHNLKIEVLDEKQIQQKGLNLLYAVGKGSQFPPRLIILSYTGNPTNKDTTALIGKGVTFDTGGYNLKPTKFIEEMRMDMSGAAVAFGTIKSAAELKIKKNIICAIPTVENAVSSKSYKPGDRYVGYSGISVEIGNTDAEGRLILADANAYVVKNYKPSRIINLATLTGAMVVTLGDYITGIFSNNDELANNIFEAGEATYERVWRLPIYDEYREDIKSKTADVKNIGRGYQAGSITAALFLEKFVGKTPWVHLDIAGTAWLESPRGYLPQCGTGTGVRLLIKYLNS